MGASQNYTPGHGIVSVQYTNVSAVPVSIRVFQVKCSCEAQSCQFLKAGAEGSWLVFKVREFKSLATSADGSYSTISGVAMSGRPFTVQAVWWSQEKPLIGVNCSPSIQRYLDSHAAPERYSPYIVSGKGVGTGGQLVLNDIDTCTPNAPHFGVPEAHVFK